MVRGKRRAVVGGPWRVALTVVAFEYLLLSPPLPPGRCRPGPAGGILIGKDRRGTRGEV